MTIATRARRARRGQGEPVARRACVSRQDQPSAPPSFPPRRFAPRHLRAWVGRAGAAHGARPGRLASGEPGGVGLQPGPEALQLVARPAPGRHRRASSAGARRRPAPGDRPPRARGRGGRPPGRPAGRRPVRARTAPASRRRAWASRNGIPPATSSSARSVAAVAGRVGGGLHALDVERGRGDHAGDRSQGEARPGRPRRTAAPCPPGGRGCRRAAGPSGWRAGP